MALAKLRVFLKCLLEPRFGLIQLLELSVANADIGHGIFGITVGFDMYTLYRLGSISYDPDALWLSYEWDSFDNYEWRPCVKHFLNEVAKHGHEVTFVSSPPFAPGEDFVEIVYLIDGKRAAFMSDHLLSLITISSEDSRVLRSVWGAIGNKMGWEGQ